MNEPYQLAADDGAADGLEQKVFYKAVQRDSKGLDIGEARIVFMVSSKGHKSAWFDADLLLENLPKYRESLIERLDPDFIPTSEWEIKL